MSVIDYCERGGMDGICVTTDEMSALAKKYGKKTIDEIIPLPDLERQEKVLKDGCPINHDEMEMSEYWEDEEGSHGWCCAVCGTVVQWG